jgi:uncharacterized protein YneF (UPF0154 family)
MIETILLLAVGFYIGYKVNDYINAHMFKDVIKDLNITESQIKQLAAKNGIELEEPQSDVPEVEVKVEQHSGCYYAYSVNDNEFMGQGTTPQELLQAIKLRFKQIRIIVREENGGAIFNQNA